MEIFKSKKFIVALCGALVSILVAGVPALEPFQDAILGILLMASSYILGQGLADFGKEGFKGD